VEGTTLFTVCVDYCETLVKEGRFGFVARVAGYMAALAMTFIGYGMIAPLISLHTSGFVGTSYLLVGMIVSLTGLIKAGFGPVSGFLSDTYGRKRLATIGASSIAVSMLIVFLANSTAMLVVGFLLYGVGQAMFFLSMMTSMVEAAGPENRAVAMGLYEGGNGIAIMIGSAASSQLVSILGVAAVFGVAAAFSAVSVLIATFILKETSTPSEVRGPILDLKGIRKLISPTYVAAMYTAFLFMYFQGGYSTIMPLYVTQTGLLDVPSLALLFVAFSGAGSLSALVTGPISDRVGRRVPILIGMALTALSYVGLYVAKAPFVLVAASLLLGFGASFFHPVASALVADISTTENRGKAFGFYRLLRDFGMFLGPMVAGVVATLLGIGALFILNAVLAAVGCLIAVLVIKETHPRK
jgi:MFS family permease